MIGRARERRRNNKDVTCEVGAEPEITLGTPAPPGGRWVSLPVQCFPVRHVMLWRPWPSAEAGKRVKRPLTCYPPQPQPSMYFFFTSQCYYMFDLFSRRNQFAARARHPLAPSSAVYRTYQSGWSAGKWGSWKWREEKGWKGDWSIVKQGLVDDDGPRWQYSLPKAPTQTQPSE